MDNDKNEQDEILNDYVNESMEQANALDDLLLELEKKRGTENADCINKMFRIFHSIKGASGFFAFHRLEKVSHKIESLLMQVRDGERVLSPTLIEIFFFAADLIKSILNQIKETKKEAEIDYSSAVALFEKELANEPIAVEEVRSVKNSYFSTEENKDAIDESLKLKLETVDDLLNLSSEIVLLKNSLTDLFKSSNDPQVVAILQQFKVVSTDLQDTIMQVRMQPIRGLWGKFPRIVRDTAKACSKEAKLVMKGEDTEVEKNILTALKDPFTHIIRNALDHGIETPEVRQAKKKNTVGVIEFNAYQKEDYVFVEIKDDGAGIDPVRVKKKAIEKKLITEDEAKSMSNQQAIELIFHPGFSTNEVVSNLSGRGVGMDVVKSSVTQLGGNVQVQSTLGVGTLLTIQIPLTLSIVPCLIVQNNDVLYGVPQNFIRQLIPYKEKEVKDGVIEYREKIIPFIKMAEVFSSKTQENIQYTNCLILETSQGVMALCVERVLNVQELVIKSMPLKTKEIKELSGNSLLSNGDIGLVINVEYLMQKFKVKEITQDIQGKIFDTNNVNVSHDNRAPYLSFNYGSKQTYAVDATMLETIIKVDKSFYVEDNIARIVYQNESVSVICPYKLLQIEYTEEMLSSSHVIILKDKNNYVGLLVYRVHDMFKVESEIFDCINRRYITGTFLMKNKMHDVINVLSLIEDLNPPVFICKEAS